MEPGDAVLLNDPYAGGSMFAKILNAYMITSPSGEAYRNRIRVLTEALTAETVRCYRGGGTARVFDMGCGPVREVQSFLAQEDISDHARFTLVDFNDETIRYARESLSSLKSSLRRFTHFEFVQNSVNNVLCEGTRLMKGKDPGHAEGLVSFGQYDMVYCAGLFDYLSDRMCKRLVEIFYRMLAPDGRMVVSNFSTANPNRGFMGYMVDWNLVHRTEEGMMSLAPGEARKDLVQLITSPNKVEYYLKIRRPPDEGQGSAEPR